MMANEQDNHSSGNAKEAEIVWRNSMLRITNTIISKSQGYSELVNNLSQLKSHPQQKIKGKD